ncbi:CpaF family protein [Alkaliphilus pronyensis]|uniref:CpaF family protein n=1 Tax=Alkaliphilus pronyensis TaxID=1482732 RepID=A0A6I0F135_9FIRM|nr:ATPase, T2SS/T4P/T4SS family [Alkaliphilus pronyensis]KAB3535637.1 CpaF family protein [Alkaliphilus pronyensis]
MIVNRLEERAKHKEHKAGEKVFQSTYEVIERIALETIKEHKDLIGEITLSKAPKASLELAVLKILNKRNYKVVDVSRKDLVKDVIDHILGYGLLQPYLDMEDCSGIFINGPDNCWIKVGKEIKRVNVSFGSIDNLKSYIRTTIQANLKGELNDDKALAKFEDPVNKLRIICAIDPVAHISPTAVFRKHKGEAFSLNDLVEMDMLTIELAEDLKRYGRAGANFIFCGRGGSGKTTLMRALLEEVQEELRILTMEEHGELFLKHPNAVQLLVKRNTKGEVYGIEELSDMGLLMTIDMYVFGEIRGAEAMSFYNGAFAGNISWTTGHSGDARKILRKMMINMKMSGTNLSDEILLDMLYESVNIIVFLDKFTVGEVVEVVPEEKEGKKYNTIWKLEKTNNQVTFIEGQHIKVGKLKSADMINKLAENKLLREEDTEVDMVVNSTTACIGNIPNNKPN